MGVKSPHRPALSISVQPPMSYQVLARKWRPKNFETLIGQEHVVRALTHALDQGRLHHAWLFTGTRGVGKTTLARILAKCLNCVGPDGSGGITSKPCGVCQACTEIDAGRFVDYIEMDAASNRGVDEMAQLLEQAIYAPSNARFKVYTIDEVHMLTNHAFNAMLKTLEEPPEHVKFILATTDPQKIPVTVLSRCLQFNLKQMPPAHIVGHLAHILEAEAIGSEREALRLLAHAATGSMRDALSLTDQAIAYSGGTVTEESVRGMLGALDQTYLIRVLDALADRDGPALMVIADEIAARSLSYGGALQDLASLLHRIAVTQIVGEKSAGASGDDAADDGANGATEAALLDRLALRFTPDEVQLHYQIAAHGRRDLGLAPDEYAGFSMTLLRMLAFRPEAGTTETSVSSRPGSAPRVGSPQAAATSTDSRAVRGDLASTKAAASGLPQKMAASIQVAREPEPRVASIDDANSFAPTPLFSGDWLAVVGQLKLTGLTRELVQQAELVDHDHRSIKLRVPIKTLLNGGTLDKLKAALATHFGRPVAVSVEVGAVQGVTAAAARQGERAARQADAEAVIAADPFVQALVRDFGASIVPGSIKPA